MTFSLVYLAENVISYKHIVQDGKSMFKAILKL